MENTFRNRDVSPSPPQGSASILTEIQRKGVAEQLLQKTVGAKQGLHQMRNLKIGI